MKPTIFLIMCYGIPMMVFGAKKRTFQCLHDVPYRENDCNYCYCDRDNMLICTSMACASHNNPVYMKCRVGNMWRKRCNTCWCTKGGGTICTAYQCDPKNNRAKKVTDNSF